MIFNQTYGLFLMVMLGMGNIFAMDDASKQEEDLAKQMSAQYWNAVNAGPKTNISESSDDEKKQDEIEYPITGPLYLQQINEVKQDPVLPSVYAVQLMQLRSGKVDVQLVEMIIEKMRRVFVTANNFHALYLKNVAKGYSPDELAALVNVDKKSFTFDYDEQLVWLGHHTLYQLYRSATENKYKFTSLFNTATDKKKGFDTYNPKQLLYNGGLIKGKNKQYALLPYVQDIIVYVVQQEKLEYKCNEYKCIINFNSPKLEELKQTGNK